MSSSEREPRFDWNDLKIFHALVSAGSMSKAARLLGVVQPTVSRRLEQLEMRIGARLVTRGADGVELTDVGERIWTLVQTMQSTANDIGRVAGQADMAEAGRVRVTAPDGIASYWIAKPLPKPLQDESLRDVFKGWLYIRSQLQQYRFVHVLNDRLFDVVFETKDSVMAKRPLMPQPSQAKGNANV